MAENPNVRLLGVLTGRAFMGDCGVHERNRWVPATPAVGRVTIATGGIVLACVVALVLRGIMPLHDGSTSSPQEDAQTGASTAIETGGWEEQAVVP